MRLSKRLLVSILLFMLTGSDLFGESGREVTSVIMRGNTGIVKLDGVKPAPGSVLADEDLRLIVTRIVSAYHEKGYMSCVVKKVSFEKDGRLLIEISEGRIGRINIIGFTESEKRGFTAAVVKAGEVYNEPLYLEKLRLFKEENRIVKMSTRFSRDTNGELILNITSIKRRNVLKTGIYNEPLFGLSAFMINEFTIKRFLVEAGLLSNRFGEDYVKRKVNFNFSGKVMEKTDLFFQLRYGELMENSSGGEVYMNYSDLSGGFSHNFGQMKLNIYGNCRRISHREPDESESISYGIGGNAGYDNSVNVLDVNEVFRFNISTYQGYDSQDGHLFSGKADFLKGIIFFQEFFAPEIYLNGHYLSNDNGSYRTYLYDRNFPVKDQYRSYTWRCLSSLYLKFIFFSGLFEAGPVFYGVFFQEDEEGSSGESSGGIRTRVKLGSIVMVLEYSSVMDQNMEDGFLSFSLTGAF